MRRFEGKKAQNVVIVTSHWLRYTGQRRLLSLSLLRFLERDRDLEEDRDLEWDLDLERDLRRTLCLALRSRSS